MADEELMDEEVKDEAEDKKAAKKKAKEEKKKVKKEKKNKEQEDDLEEESDGIGSKIAVFFITLMIILIWLAIFALLIKSDVGGFGSSVMTPILQDVPYLNQILPNSGSSDVASTEDAQYRYASMDEAVEYIKELELALAEAQQSNTEEEAYVAQLEAEVAKLKVYEEEQSEFEKIQEKFYEEVVFSDSAPDISEYIEYYESIEPENAEILYQAAVAETLADEEMDDYVAKYSNMSAKAAAAIFDEMTDNLQLVAEILMAMDNQSAADILGKMDSETAALVTEIMYPSE